MLRNGLADMWIDARACVAGFFLMMSFLPQVVKSARTKKTEDVSLGMLIFTLISGVLYEIYAFALVLIPVIIMNGLFVLVVIQLSLKLRYDNA